MASEVALQRFDQDMDLITHLEEENSKQNWQVVVDYVGNDSSRFDAVVNLFINGQQKIVQRI